MYRTSIAHRASRISLTSNFGSTRTLSSGRCSKNGIGTTLVVVVIVGGLSSGNEIVVEALSGPILIFTTAAVRLDVTISFQSYPHFQIPVPRWAIVSSPHFVSVLNLHISRMYEYNAVLASTTF